ncbi:sodium-dependent noradrenaline transporter-like protein 1 [Sarcoptes scabiei]|uniref:Transporter n=1 Tax=Sarcoptes scabiei TaxID=52283 RepID=A0A132A530_SARSC|nr:sodium-dependent noradrenaline transporter-like protein 1 [Sarcoptes scabiei]
MGYNSLHSTPKRLTSTYCVTESKGHSTIFSRPYSEILIHSDLDNYCSSSEEVREKHSQSPNFIAAGANVSARCKQNDSQSKWISSERVERIKTQSKTHLQDENANTVVWDRNQIPEREQWGEKIDFLLSIIGFAVDLSNVWRFPYLCYKNGGGVFLIPYSTMLLFGALPLFFMELSLGQWAKTGPISLWSKICPPLKGIGYCFVLISWYVSFYYNVIIAWTISYVIKTLVSGIHKSSTNLIECIELRLIFQFDSLTKGEQMPWQHCGNWYNTQYCISMDEIKLLRYQSNVTEENLDRLSEIGFINKSDVLFKNYLYKDANSNGNKFSDSRFEKSSIAFHKLSNRTSPTEEFFNLGLLEIDQSNGLESLGYIRTELVGCLLIVFIILYFSLFKGVVWVTATAPYFILTILLIRGLFLPGSITGILYYINPQLHKLLEPMVWVDAAVQVFYSIGVGFGVHLTYASFNKFNNNCYRDCLITASVNSLTSFYSGFVIFTYLGYMADSMDKDIENVASEGYGLVFQVYPEAISTLPFAKFWSLLFFLMLLTLGIDSAMGGIEAVITGLMDEFNLHHRFKREYFTALIICLSFLGSIINCTQGGAFTMVWFDTYSAGISLIASAMFETIAVMYLYGRCRKILLRYRINDRPSTELIFRLLLEIYIAHFFDGYQSIILGRSIPIMDIFLPKIIIIMSIANSESISYYGYDFPLWATISGWCFTLSSIAAIPIYASIYYIRKWLRSLDRSTVIEDEINLQKLNHIAQNTSPILIGLTD